MPSKNKCPHINRPIFSKGRCKQCAMKEYKPLKRTSLKKNTTRIKIASPVRAKMLHFYSVLRKSFLLKRPLCEARLENCSFYATDIHHPRGKIGVLLIASTYFKGLCRSCHNKVTVDSKLAIELGLSESRLSENVTFLTAEELLFLEQNHIKHG
jgi:hypothetical protein